MKTTFKGKTPDELAAQGHWNGHVVEAAHERLFARVEHVRTTRQVSVEAAIAEVYFEVAPGSKRASPAPDLQIYIQARDRMLGLKEARRRVTREEFAHWMTTGQLVGAKVPASLKLRTEERRQAFVDLMVRIERMVAGGLSNERACARLVGEAMQSTFDQPNEARKLLLAVWSARGRKAPVEISQGLPSSSTVSKWWWKHTTGQVAVDLQPDSAPLARVRRSATFRWKAVARKMVAAKPALSPLSIHTALVLDWRKSWGKPVNRKVFIAWVKAGCVG